MRAEGPRTQDDLSKSWKLSLETKEEDIGSLDSWYMFIFTKIMLYHGS